MSSFNLAYFEPIGSWNAKVRVEYSHYGPYQKAEAALSGLWLVLLIGLAVSTLILKKPRNAVTFSVFRVHKFWLALTLLILFYAFRFAYQIVEQNATDVTEAYILVTTIFGSFDLLAGVILLAVIFSLLYQLFRQLGASYSKYRGILWVNYALCGVLFLLYIAIFGLAIRELYLYVFNYEFTIPLVNGRPVRFVLIVIYNAIYTVVGLEIFACSFILFPAYRNTYHQNNSVPFLFILIIALPLLISSLFTLGYNATFLLSFADFTVQYIDSVTLAHTFIYGLAHILIFSALLAIGVQAEDSNDQHDLEYRPAQEGQHAPSHVPLGYENELNDKGVRSEPPRQIEWRDRVAGWRPSFRKGGKSGLGLKMAF